MTILDDLNYDPETGEFTWAVTRGFIRKGKRAGGLSRGKKNGNVYITYADTRYLAARIAWAKMTGASLRSKVSFKNGDKQDLRFNNLFANRARVGVTVIDHDKKKSLTFESWEEVIAYAQSRHEGN